MLAEIRFIEDAAIASKQGWCATFMIEKAHAEFAICCGQAYNRFLLAAEAIADSRVVSMNANVATDHAIIERCCDRFMPKVSRSLVSH